jgi:hypothetical protein
MRLWGRLLYPMKRIPYLILLNSGAKAKNLAKTSGKPCRNRINLMRNAVYARYSVIKSTFSWKDS